MEYNVVILYVLTIISGSFVLGILMDRLWLHFTRRKDGQRYL